MEVVFEGKAALGLSGCREQESAFVRGSRKRGRGNTNFRFSLILWFFMFLGT